MRKLNLKYDKMLQGDFKAGALNFLFSFQVNCPGCFLYGMPVFNSLYKEYGDRINFLGLSTAFEDFELNNKENTVKLLSDKTIVGETYKALAERGYDHYPQDIEFSVAMDDIVDQNDIDADMIEQICLLNPNFTTWPEYDKDLLRKKVTDYLMKIPSVFYTFTTNQFRGTPTFVLFNEQYEIYDAWFGHRAPEEIKKTLTKWL